MLLGAALAASTIYLALLFWLAAWRDRAGSSSRLGSPRASGWIYGLSLAVYCTSWTFFGGVGTAATAGLDYVPIYLGPILVFTLGYGLVRRILAQSKAQHSTSIADFLSARYGQSAAVAALVTVIATAGSLHYMALQLQSVDTVLTLIGGDQVGAFAETEMVGMIAILKARFRRSDQPWRQSAGLLAGLRAVPSALAGCRSGSHVCRFWLAWLRSFAADVKAGCGHPAAAGAVCG